MRKILALTLILVLLIGLTLPAFAASGSVHDYAGLLSEEEIATLNVRIREITGGHPIDIVILTTNDPYIRNAEQHTLDFYERRGYGIGETRDGVILHIDMLGRGVYFRTFGRCIPLFGRRDVDRVLDRVQPLLSDGEYFAAVQAFLAEIETALAQVDTLPDYPPVRPLSQTVIISVIIGVLVAGAVLGIMLLVHGKSLPAAPSHHAYMEGGVKVKHQLDRFVTSNLIRVPIPRNTGGGGGGGLGGGLSSGGGSRRF